MHRKLFHKLDDEMYQKQVTSGTFARDGVIEAEEGADTPVLLCLLSPDDCVPVGLMWFKRQQLSYS